MIARLIAVARSGWVRAIVALCGAATVILIVRGLGWTDVRAALSGAERYFPAVLALEALIVACSMLALRSLYGAAGSRIPVSQLVRAGLLGYAINGLVPAGRAVAEVARGAMLARWVGRGPAAAAATRMQAVVLVGHGVMSVAATFAAMAWFGRSWVTYGIAMSAAVATLVGVALLAITSRSRIGRWLGRRFSGAQTFGAELDDALARGPAIPVRAIGWELTGRCVELAQKAVLIVGLGGVARLTTALCVEGIHLLGAAVGDLVPAQLGVQEGNFAAAANALGLPTATAVSIALLAHLSQLTWVLIGSLGSLLWPKTTMENTP